MRGGRFPLPYLTPPKPSFPPTPPLPHVPTFVAIDFETADRYNDSACAIALVRVEAGQVVHREKRLIRPPRPEVHFTEVHGITWEDVEDQPTFGQLWPDLAPLLEGAHFLTAHNAPFDRGVLAACLDAAKLMVPDTPFICTVTLSRKLWGQRHNRLNDVSQRLGIPLKHHDPLSDAEACAHIVLAALREAKSSPETPLPEPFAFLPSAAQHLRLQREAQAARQQQLARAAAQAPQPPVGETISADVLAAPCVEEQGLEQPARLPVRLDQS
ncbi:MAG: hypothetical protein EXR67_05530 [Dehalococcoidia bacterium]|nr:hypothetical protein [Dehalococcoidia bacterium]